MFVSLFRRSNLPTFVSELRTDWHTPRIEASCVLVAACIPMLMPLLELWFGADFLSRRTLQLQSLSFRYGFQE